MNQQIVGVDIHQVQESFDDVLASSLRTNPDMLVVVARVLSDANMRSIARAHMAGIRVHIEQDKATAPADTRWLTNPIL